MPGETEQPHTPQDQPEAEASGASGGTLPSALHRESDPATVPPNPPVSADAAETAPARADASQAGSTQPVPPQLVPGQQPVPGHPGTYAQGATPQPGWPPQPVLLAHPPRPPHPGFFETRWKGPGVRAGRAAVIGTIAGALGGAIFVPLDRPGIGWLVSGLISATMVGVAARTAGVRVSLGYRVARAGWGVAALALLSVGTFRAAGWLFFCCLLAALGCASLAAAGGRSLRAMIVSALLVPLAAFRALPWVAAGLPALLPERRAAKVAPPISSATGGQAPNAAARRSSGPRIFVAMIVTLFLLLIFGGLLASADDAFAELLGRPLRYVLDHLDVPTVFVWIVLLVAGGLFTAGGIFLVSAPPDLHRMESPGKPRIGGFELALPLGALVLLFGGFVAVQFTVLFADRTNVLRTAGVTYAEYARSGFRQLIVVTVLTLIVIAAPARWARRETRSDRLLLRALLGGVAMLSLVIVASAIYRLWLYQDYRGWTRERIFVGAVEIGLGMIFVLILIAGVRLKGEWLTRAVAATAVTMLLALAVLNPERFMAEQNVARYENSGKIIDLFYLRALSADATPALAKLPPDMRRCALSQIARDLEQDPDTWYAWNYARQEARQVLADLGAGATGSCRDAYRFDNERG